MLRREFLSNTAVGLSMCYGSRATAADSKSILVGQIGTKHAHASGQMETLRKLSATYQVVGVVEPDDKQWARVSNSRAYKDVPRLTEQQLLATPNLEAVAVETEIRDLLATAYRCVQKGIHVHVDKPAGESLSELVALQTLARKQSVTIQMGYMYRYNPGFLFLYDAVRNGWLGKIFEVHAVMSKTSGDEARREMAQYPGGAMFELGCHLIDPLLHILGSPTDVTPFHRQSQSDQKLLDNTLAVFEYPHATATIRSALIEVNGSQRRQFVVCGDEGTITIRPLETPKLELTLRRPRADFPKGTTRVDLPKSKGRYYGAWESLATAIRGKAKLAYTHEHDYTVQKAILAASDVRPWK